MCLYEYLGFNYLKTMKFLGQDPVRCKLVVDNKRLQVKNFKLLVLDIC